MKHTSLCKSLLLISLLFSFLGLNSYAAEELPWVLNIQVSSDGENEILVFEACNLLDEQQINCEILGDKNGYIRDEISGLKRYNLLKTTGHSLLAGAAAVATIVAAGILITNPIGIIGSGIFILATYGTSVTPIAAMVATGATITAAAGGIGYLNQSMTNEEMLEKVLNGESREFFTTKEIEVFSDMLHNLD